MKNRFNPSLSVPIIDIAIAVVLIVAGGLLWYHTDGSATVHDAFQTLSQKRSGNEQELNQTLDALAETQAELEAAREEREAKAQYAEFLMDRVQQEQAAMLALWEEQRPFVERAADLRADIARYKDTVRAFRTDIMEAEWKIESKRAEIADLEQRVQQRLAEVDPGAIELQAALEKPQP